jgi:transposase
MPFAGLDLHQKMVEAVIVDADGRLLLNERFPATRAALEAFARRHLAGCAVALEATVNTWPVAALLEPFAAEVVVSNPLRTRAIASAKIKTDRVDATVLAQLLRLDYLPRVWQPDPQTRQLRRHTTERANLVGDRTRLKNRIHAVLHQRLIEAPRGDLFSARNLDWLAALPLDPEGKESLGRHLRQLAATESELALLEERLAHEAYDDPRAKLLLTLPGVDIAVAQALLAALGDVDRFPDGNRAAAYLGLVPSTYQSGEHCYHGRITKQGRSHARWLLVQAAQHIDAHPGPLGVFFRRIARKKNRNVAVVATARKLVWIAWHMLKHHEPYRYAQPQTVQAKFARLRVRVTGKRKRSGLPKGSPRPAAYGTGQGTRAIPALEKVYGNEQLPPLAAPRAGEQKMLERHAVTGFVAGIHRERRAPRGKTKPQPPGTS